MANNQTVIETWLRDLALRRSATLSNEGRLQAFRLILGMPRPTRSALLAAARAAHLRADRHYVRQDVVNHDVWRGMAEGFADALDLLPWPS